MEFLFSPNLRESSFQNINYFHIASKRLEEISDIRFLSEKNEDLKNIVVTSISSGFDDEKLKSKINFKFNKIIQEIKINGIKTSIGSFIYFYSHQILS